MTSLFSYIVTVDDGSAPNPFFGMCSLAICKPAIRRTAKIGDWVAGIASRKCSLAGRLVYAMRVDEIVTIEEYDRRAPRDWPERIPGCYSTDFRRRKGDCIYDFSQNEPIIRDSVHNRAHQKADLSGKNVLISQNFRYFGQTAKLIPDELRAIIPTNQGHFRPKNDPFVFRFVSWIEDCESFGPGKIGNPGCNHECSWHKRPQHGHKGRNKEPESCD